MAMASISSDNDSNLLINDELGLNTEENISNRNSQSSIHSLESRIAKSTRMRTYLSIIILTLVNLINYMDRYSIAGILIKVELYYGLSKTQAGLLSTIFVVSYMLLSPIFGFMGDRWNRKLIMSCGIFFWSLISFSSSFVAADKFPLFLVLRGFVGIGEASYSTIAPTLIADFFKDGKRTRALSLFYFAIPVGSGLGYIVGAKVAEYMDEWQWALRITPVIGVACSILVAVVIREPSRGASDESTYLEATSWFMDLKYLLTHKSFMLSTLGFTCVAFVAGALALWAPEYIYYSILIQPSIADEYNVSLWFGIITCFAGLLGVASGSILASFFRKKTRQADPLVCAFGLISSAPFLFLAIYLSRYNTAITLLSIFIGETFLFLNWALVSDMVLYLVIPTRRSTAEAIQILTSHALGDAGSPTLIGIIYDGINKKYAYSDRVIQYQSLQFALYVMCFVCVLGGGFFLATAIFIEKDRKTTEEIMKGKDQLSSPEQSKDIYIRT